MHRQRNPVVAVSAFNHPLNLIVHQVSPAIAAGNAVIVKPAEDTPLSCYRFVALLREAGLPEGWCQALVVKDTEIATALVSDLRVAFFSFICSVRVGWMLRAKLAAGTRCALEHAGAAPVILEADADLDKAIPLPYALQAAVFTRDLDKALYASRRLDASAVMVNDHTAFRVDWMPFAGLRQSGLGTGGIPYTFDDMRVEKLTVLYSDAI